MLFYSRNSTVAHFDGCRHLKHIRKENAAHFITYAEARKNGVHLCKHCDPVATAYRKESEDLIAYCAQNGLICFLQDSAVHLQTVHSKWKLMPSDGGSLVLYHKNTHFRKEDLKSDVAGYHLQKFKYRDMVETCQYVVEHDTYRYQNPLKKEKNAGQKKQSPKGSRKWRAQQERIKRQKRRAAIKNVYFLFDQIEAARA